MSVSPSHPPVRSSQSLSAGGFTRRMIVAFGLMVFIPLLVLVYVYLQREEVPFVVILISTTVASVPLHSGPSALFVDRA